MKILVIIAVLQTVSVFANAQGAGGCNFDPIAACDRCDYSRSYVQYVPNECNCNEYYSCEKTRGHITAHKQVCPPCLCFSKETWGCTIHNGEECPTEPPITERVIIDNEYCYRYGNGPQGDYLQKYSAGDSDDTFNWIVNEFPVKMLCPAGTYFDLSKCQCLNCIPGKYCRYDKPLVFCLDWENQNSEHGIWYNADESCSVYNDYSRGSPNHELQLPGGPCNVEIPFFQNNEFSAFTLCGWFKPSASNIGHEQGLAFDGGKPGDDCHPGSIYITLGANNRLSGGIRTTDAPGSYSTSLGLIPINANEGYQVCLRYNGASLDLAVKDDATLTETVSTVAASGVTLKNKCNMMLGANFDFAGIQNFFEGLMDDWCFYRTAVTPFPFHP